MVPLALNVGRAHVNGPLAPSWRSSVDAAMTAELLEALEAEFAPCAFVRIERVRGDGSTAHHTRPGLGKHAQRDAPCPRVLIPGARELSAPAIKAFATADLVVVDLQRLRGQRALRNVRAV